MGANSKLGAVAKTERGFQSVRFLDSYGTPSNLSCSSIIGDYEDSLERPGSSAVWLGIDKVEAKVMAKDAHLVGISVTEKAGWVDFPVPDPVLLTARMHLNREQVAGLIERLQAWLDTGSLSG